jgi:hypothetical protein
VKEKLTKSTPEHLQLRDFPYSEEGLGNLCCFNRITYVCYCFNRDLLLHNPYHMVGGYEKDPEGREGKRDKSGIGRYLLHIPDYTLYRVSCLRCVM